ncbi:unnamed protein product, partial [Urochloa humidicola]
LLPVALSLPSLRRRRRLPLLPLLLPLLPPPSPSPLSPCSAATSPAPAPSDPDLVRPGTRRPQRRKARHPELRGLGVRWGLDPGSPHPHQRPARSAASPLPHAFLLLRRDPSSRGLHRPSPPLLPLWLPPPPSPLLRDSDPAQWRGSEWERWRLVPCAPPHQFPGADAAAHRHRSRCSCPSPAFLFKHEHEASLK